MSHFGDFMDGVPVKISEKYKRPPRFELPYSVLECPLRAQSVVGSVQYCSTFERNVLVKLKELKSAKETKKNERKHRLQLLEEAKQKKLDAIAAAEAEERLKQLSVSEVSYPSTEEISALSPDDKLEKNFDPSSTQDNSPEADVAVHTEHLNPCTSTQESQNILQPIQVQSNYPQNSLLDDPDPLQEYKIQTKRSKIPYNYNHNINSLTYKDFENDTSSPFDNVELKTINDMEMLAQVLQSQRESTTSCAVQTYAEQAYGYTNCATQAQMGVECLPESYIEQQIQGPNVIYSSPQHYPGSNGYYVQPDQICDSIPVDNTYIPNYQYYVPTQTYTGAYYSQLPVGSGEIQVPTDPPFIPQPYYLPYNQVPQSYATAVNTPEMTNNKENILVGSQNAVKSRSRSVPDIVKELNEELASARQRATDRSYNASPAPVNVPRSLSGSDKKEEKRKRRIEKLPNPYEKLPPLMQTMCKKIHGMGFPLDRVARVCSLVGENDKKVIECLLILGELMDLGLSEARVLAALAKHEFNRDKALDELVS